MKFYKFFSELLYISDAPNKRKANFEDCKSCRKEFCQMGNNDFC